MSPDPPDYEYPPRSCCVSWRGEQHQPYCRFASAGIQEMEHGPVVKKSDLLHHTGDPVIPLRSPLIIRTTPGEVRVTDPDTGGQKGQKPERYDLIPWEAVDPVARVYGYGAQKYEDWNWLKGYAWSLSLGAMLRHITAFARGEDVDPESGLPHLAHAVFHCLTLITFQARGLGTDDRIPTAPSDPPATL